MGDILIIGGGFAGLEAARFFAKKRLKLNHRRVVLVDTKATFDFLLHRKVYNTFLSPPDLPRKSKRLGLRKSPMTGDKKSSPKAIFLRAGPYRGKEYPALNYRPRIA